MDQAIRRSPSYPAGEIGTTANESLVSAVSWSAVIAGAFAAAALSVALLVLGLGLGLSSVSPWSSGGASATAMGVATILWLIAMQIIASSLGGWLAGRLRTKWVDVHTDEVFFRDTAHGFLVWTVGLVISAAFLASASSAIVGGFARVGAGLTIGGGAAAAATAAVRSGDQAGDSNAYFVDSLFRSETPPAGGPDQSERQEASRIFARGLGDSGLPPKDASYIAQRIAAKTGLSQADAEKRVTDTIAQAKKIETDARQAADTARKAAMHASLWMFVSLLIGAFGASYAATIGGRQRDRVHGIAATLH